MRLRERSDPIGELHEDRVHHQPSFGPRGQRVRRLPRRHGTQLLGPGRRAELPGEVHQRECQREATWYCGTRGPCEIHAGLDAKDTQNLISVPRSISVRVDIVQLSAVFLAFALSAFVLIGLGLAGYAYRHTRHKGVLENMPQSKLDWMIETIQVGRRTSEDGGRHTFASSLVNNAMKTGGNGMTKKRRRLFDNAMYHVDHREVCGQRDPEARRGGGGGGGETLTTVHRRNEVNGQGAISRSAPRLAP